MSDPVRDLHDLIDERIRLAGARRLEIVRGVVQTVDSDAYRLSAYLDGSTTVTPAIAYTSGVASPMAGDEILVLRRPDGYHLVLSTLVTTTNAAAKSLSQLSLDLSSLEDDVVGLGGGPDTDAPAIPTNVTTAGGYRLFGAVWDRNTEPDLAKYQIRYAPEDATPGDPDTALWTVLTVDTTSIVVTDLDAGTPSAPTAEIYYVQVRAIDTHDNVRTSATDATAVDYTTNPEAGWSNDGTDEAYETVSPSLVSGSADVAYGTVIAQHIAAAGITAAKITSGTLSVGGQPNMPDYLLIFDSSGDEIGRWDQDGLLIKDPDVPDSRIRFVNGILAFSSDGGATYSTAISADGILANAIQSGVLPGGHNAVPNASLELKDFAATLSKIWTSAADWQSHLAGDINFDDSGVSAAMTTDTF
jgi:hypothetical protein